MNDARNPVPDLADDIVLRYDAYARRPDGLSPSALRARLEEAALMSPARADRLVQALAATPVVVVGRDLTPERAERARRLGRVGLEVVVTPTEYELLDDPFDQPGLLHGDAPAYPAPKAEAASVQKLKKPEGAPRFTRQASAEGVDAPHSSWPQGATAWPPTPSGWAPASEPPVSAAAGPRGGMPSVRPVAARDSGHGWKVAAAAAALGLAGVLAFWDPADPPHWLPTWARSELARASDAGLRAAAVQRAAAADRAIAQLDDAPPAASMAGDPALAATMPDADALSALAQSTREAGQGPGLAVALAAPGAGPVALPADLPAGLLSELALTLAQSGQSARAYEAVQALMRQPDDGDPQAAAQRQRVRMLVDAWSLPQLPASLLAPRLTALRQDAGAIADPALRASVLSELAAVLARQPQLPETLVQGLLAQSSEAVQQEADGPRRAALAEAGRLDAARVQWARARMEAAGGHASRLAARLRTLDVLTAQLSDPAALTQALALRADVARMAGQTHGGNAWQDALAHVGDPLVRALVLRDVAALHPGALDEPLRQEAQRLVGLVDTAPAPLRARTLAQLSLLWSAAGQAERAEPLRQKALQLAGGGDDGLRLRAELLARPEMALATAAQRAGDYAGADAHWRKLAAYLI